MGITRVLTQGVHAALVGYTFYKMGVKGYVLVLLGNIGLLLQDVYFTAVIFSYYKRSAQEEIEIELKRLG